MSRSESVGNESEVTDDREESPSSDLESVESRLALFREKWQRELQISPKLESAKGGDAQQVTDSDSSTIENTAKKLFRLGIEHEQCGKLYEAIQFYKRAVQLVPDIEFRLYESSKPKVRERVETSEILEEDVPNSKTQSDEDHDDDADLLAKISKIVYKNQRVCDPHFEQSVTHISSLPMEIILYILRWVVSSELDLRSLEMFSRVCRGFYVSARDPEIWRLACIRAWGVNCGTFEPQYCSWRHMYVERPRLRYNGCYISKTTYIRHGENSFQDQFYRPWHLIEYYRYLRFFPEGRVIMLTSADEAQTCVNSLKQRTPRNPSALIGHYRLRDNYVTLVLKKQESKTGGNNAFRRNKRPVIHDSGEQTFHVELEIQNVHRRANSQLTWKTYNIFTEYRNGQQSTTGLNLVNALYPSFRFSRVKSYAVESDSPLQ